MNNQLLAISPIDGRYRTKVEELAAYFSEFALIKYRVFVEIEYFIALCEIPLPQLRNFDKHNYQKLRQIFNNFTTDDAAKVKGIENITNHDVKAVEYFLKEKFENLGLSSFKEFIHFALTSQDINNTSVPFSLKVCAEKILNPEINKVVDKIRSLSDEFKDIVMIARTHGQPASPTKMGKELYVFVERLENQIKLLKTIPFNAKFGGATGNLNAHYVAFPEINWIDFSNNFINNILGLSRLQTTTQIEHYDNMAAYFDNWKRINTILIDFCRDVWTYISLEYFKQKIKKGEVGSSTMPHKVNPIDFENAEGNLGMANAIFEHLSSKLPVSRLQRDLTDSTVLRNIGIPFAHSLIAYKSIVKGLDKLLINNDAIKADIEENWIVVSEAIQTILRREGYPNPYEVLKELTRKNQKITSEDFNKFIQNLDVSQNVKDELKKITPYNYTGNI
jgi:adenylosuccinate lyase